MKKQILTLLFCASTLTCYADSNMNSVPNILLIQSEGTVNLQGSVADVLLGIEVTERNPDKAQELLSKRQTDVLAALRQAGAEQLETRAFSLYPQYDRERHQEIIGYIASTSLSFSVPVAKVGELVEVAIKAGANQNQGISVRATADELKAARIEALEQASGRALEEGQAVLESLALKLKGIRRIDVTPSAMPYLASRQYAYKNAEASASAIEVTEQKLTVTAQVALELEYREKE